MATLLVHKALADSPENAVISSGNLAAESCPTGETGRSIKMLVLRLFCLMLIVNFVAIQPDTLFAQSQTRKSTEKKTVGKKTTTTRTSQKRKKTRLKSYQRTRTSKSRTPTRKTVRSSRARLKSGKTPVRTWKKRPVPRSKSTVRKPGTTSSTRTIPNNLQFEQRVTGTPPQGRSSVSSIQGSVSSNSPVNLNLQSGSSLAPIPPQEYQSVMPAPASDVMEVDRDNPSPAEGYTVPVIDSLTQIVFTKTRALQSWEKRHNISPSEGQYLGYQIHISFLGEGILFHKFQGKGAMVKKTAVFPEWAMDELQNMLAEIQLLTRQKKIPPVNDRCDPIQFVTVGFKEYPENNLLIIRTPSTRTCYDYYPRDYFRIVDNMGELIFKVFDGTANEMDYPLR